MGIRNFVTVKICFLKEKEALSCAEVGRDAKRRK
jgi:hypothetical protein